MTWVCYILSSLDPKHPNLTYNGSTNNLARRLRQHNGEIVGGARQTKRGRPWKVIATLSGFPNHKNALSCEWRIRHPTNSRKRPPEYCGPVGRIKALVDIVFPLTHWTKQCLDVNDHDQLSLWVDPLYKDLAGISVPIEVSGS